MAQTAEERREYRRRWRAEHRDEINAHKRAWYSEHREQVCEINREQQKAHPEAALERNRKWAKAHPERVRALKYKHRYGISIEEAEQLVIEQQNGVCALCGGNRTECILEVDHDHITGGVRGLLCKLCNLGLGSFERESPNPPALAVGSSGKDTCII